MILADKIIMLRKKAGWSQEELAAQLGVSRQSVSKWEGAQSVPDIDRILQMSRLFGISTDYLLKDELGEPEYPVPEVQTETEPPLRRVTMEEASSFIAKRKNDAPKLALAVFMCVISPAVLLMLTAMSEVSRFGISEEAAVGIGVSVILVLVAAAVAIFITCCAHVKEFEFLEDEAFETEYGVSGMVRERRNEYNDTYTRMNIIATVLCILSAVPIIAAGGMGAPDIMCVAAVCVLLFLVGIAAGMFVFVGTYKNALNKLLEEGDYTRSEKSKRGVRSAVTLIYWLTVTAIFLFYTFGPMGNMQAQYSWFIWAIGGVLYAAVMAALYRKENRPVRKGECNGNFKRICGFRLRAYGAVRHGEQPEDVRRVYGVYRR